MGDSVGHWEGDTLVVETRNFRPEQSFRGSSENVVVTERFTRVANDKIVYRFTVDDPATFTSPFTGELPFVQRRRQHLRVRLPRRQLRAARHPLRRARSGEGTRE